MIQLPENFETYAEARKAGFLRMKELKESGHFHFIRVSSEPALIHLNNSVRFHRLECHLCLSAFCCQNDTIFCILHYTSTFNC